MAQSATTTASLVTFSDTVASASMMSRKTGTATTFTTALTGALSSREYSPTRRPSLERYWVLLCPPYHIDGAGHRLHTHATGSLWQMSRKTELRRLLGSKF